MESSARLEELLVRWQQTQGQQRPAAEELCRACPELLPALQRRIDDLLATGGTAEATAKLATSLGAEIAGLAFVVELDFLKGRDKLKSYDVFSLLHYDK